MSVIIAILGTIVGACCIVLVGYAAILGGAVAFFVWQEKRAWRRHDRQRAEGF
jgi:hypothetical protein